MSKKAKILCVDDETDLRENIKMILESEGYEIIEAADGAQAYEKFTLSQPDLVLSDISMPVMDGHELLNKLRKNHAAELNDVPFIFLTALGEKQNYLDGVKLGADEYIVKPIDFDILISTIDAKLKKSAEHRDATQQKLLQLCEKVSHLIPKEIQHPLHNIITLSTTLKKEMSNLSSIEKKYADYAGRIYMSSLRLNAHIVKAFDKNSIINVASHLDHFVSISDIVEQIKQDTKDQKVSFKLQNNLPDISVRKEYFISEMANYLKQHELSKSKNIKFDVFQDYLNNLIFSISAKTLLPVFSEKLEHMIEEFNGEFNVQDNDGITYHIITFPNYMLSNKK